MLPKTDAAKYAEKNSNTTLLPSGKLRFDQTGMEFPAHVTTAILNAYATGKSFRRAVARRQNDSYDFTVHEPYILPHKDRDHRHFIYCTLTKATLPRDRAVVQNHVSTKRFTRLRKEAEERKQRQEEHAHKRREKRAQTEKARNAADGKSEPRSAEANAGETDVPMEQDGNDVLDGIISDNDESSNSDAGANEPEETANRVGKSEREGQGESVEDDKMEGDEKESEEKNNFWVRGRKEALHDMMEDDGDDGDEWEEPKKKNVRPKRTKKKISGTKSLPGTSHAGANESRKEDTVTGKRHRVAAAIPKKVRQARQRRKAVQKE